MTIHFQHQESGTVKNLLHHFSVFVIVFFFFFSFSTFFSDCLIIDQLGWLLFNVQKKAISHGQNENLIHSQDQDKNFDDYSDEIFKVRPNTLCVKKSNNGEIIGGE